MMHDSPLDIAAVVAEVSAHGGYADSAQQVIDQNFQRFRRFCAEHAVDALPAKEDILLAFLESMRPHLAAVHARSLVEAVSAVHHQSGHGRPEFTRVRQYVRALRLDEEVPTPQPRVDALSEGEVEAMVGKMIARLGNVTAPKEVRTMRAAAVLVRAGIVPRSWFDTASVTTRPGGAIWVSCGGVDRLFDAGTVEHKYLNEADTSDLVAFGSKRFSRRLVSAARRAGVSISGAHAVTSLNPADFDALLDHCDPSYERNVRDLAYVCAGIAGALRHISLANLDIRDVASGPDGVTATFRVAKLPPGEVLSLSFPHLSGGGSACTDSLCAACALDRQLTVCRRQGRTEGPLLGTKYGRVWRVMTRQNGRLRLVNLWEPEHAAGPKRIATRSLRVTGATWASLEGLTISQIAEFITFHRDTAIATLYIHQDQQNLEFHPVLG